MCMLVYIVHVFVFAQRGFARQWPRQSASRPCSGGRQGGKGDLHSRPWSGSVPRNIVTAQPRFSFSIIFASSSFFIFYSAGVPILYNFLGFYTKALRKGEFIFYF